ARTSAIASSILARGIGGGLCNVLGEDVCFQINRRAKRPAAKERHLLCMWDQGDREPVVRHVDDGQAHPVNSDRPFRDDVAHYLPWRAERGDYRVAFSLPVGDGAERVD